MDKRRLQCFVALAEELHFRRAAARSHISQPGLSQQLRQLEAQVQAQLFFRNKRRVSLTRAGEVFLVEARKLLRAMDAAVDLTQQTDRGLIGQLLVGATPTALFVAMPEIMERFGAALPDVTVSIRQMTTAEQEAALRSGDIHVGLVHPPLEDSSILSQEIASLPFDVVMSTRNPLMEKETLRFRDLAQQKFVLFPRAVGPRLYDQIIALCHSEGFSPDAIIEAAPAQSIVAMAACNLGIGFVASQVQHFDRPLVAYRKLEGAAPRLTLGVAYGSESTSPVAGQFLRIAAEVGRAIR